MKIKDVIKYLNEYADKEQEIIIAWNDKEWLNSQDETATNDQWLKAVAIYEDSEVTGFGDDCRWAIQEAKYNLEKEVK